MSVRILLLNTVIVVIGLPFIVGAWLAPFSFYVDIEWVDYKDVCAGDSIQTVFALRDVKWSDSYNGSVIEELVRYQNDLIFETVISRKADFIYQKSSSPVVYEIEWNHPLPAGDYGINSAVTIDTLFKKKDFRSHEIQKFTVHECQ